MLEVWIFRLKAFTSFFKQQGWGNGKDYFLSARNICPLLRISIVLLFLICWGVERTGIAKNAGYCIEEILQNHVEMKWEVASKLSFRCCYLHYLYPESSISKQQCYGSGGPEKNTCGPHKKTFFKDALCKGSYCRAEKKETSQLAIRTSNWL